MTLLLDFETASKADLKEVGGRNYAAHPTTEVLVAVVHDVESGETGVWSPGDPPIVTNDVLVAHNGRDFDRHVAARVGWTSSHPWSDTSEAARRAGLPGALDALGTRWLGLAKDKVAAKFTKSLSKYADLADAPPPADTSLAALTDKRERSKRRAAHLKEWRKRPAAERREAVRKIVTDYCASDVAIMEHGWPRLVPYLEHGVFGGWERDVLAVDGFVNERGIRFDSELARALLKCDDVNREIALESAARVLGWSTEQVRAVANSPVQFAAVTGWADAKRETVDAIIAGAGFEEPWIVALAEARSALATIERGKLEAGLARVSPDGRLRDNARYYGAHTGRWSGRGMQLQNIPRPEDAYSKWGEEEIARAIDTLGNGRIVPQGEISVLLRSCLLASDGCELAVCDFSNVEARWLAWTAGDAAATEVFVSGKSPYIAAASVIYGLPYDSIAKGTDMYDIGKKSVLGCGYGMGANKFELKYQPSRAGVDAAVVVRAWRELHAPIVRYWKALENAFMDAIRGVARNVWPYQFVPSADGRDVAIYLPSGRPIIYNEVGFSREVGFNGRERLAPYYIGTKGNREHLYGGKIAENVTQAGCRDLMAEALVASAEEGLCPVLHVHDELVNEVPRGAEGYEVTHQIMTRLPEWAPGFPVGAAGHWGRRYRK